MKACKGCSGSKELNHKDCYFHNDGYCTFEEKQEGKMNKEKGMEEKMDITEVAKQIKNEEAQNIINNPESFPADWVEIAKRRRLIE